MSTKDYLYRVGLGHVGSYQVSGVPYASASIMAPGADETPYEVKFPGVTRWVCVKNETPTASGHIGLRVGFSSLGTVGALAENKNYFVLNNGETFRGDWRVSSIYLLSNLDAPRNVTASVWAGCTVIPTESLTKTAYPNWSGTMGVG
jgi:hypothetical protein